MKKLVILFTLLLSLHTFADDLQKGLTKTFNVIGSVQTVKYKPVNSPLNFDYDIQYYIPSSLKGKNNLNTLVFLHGGGQSTMTREGSLNVTKMYMNDLKTVADALGIILIMPSGSGNNWGGHMISLLRDLNQTIRAELPVNSDKIALSGHSMGGMGITRSAHWLTDEYAFFMPTAAGMDEKHQTEANLRPYMNMKYYHMQGLQDHFKVFITRCENQQRAIDELERKYNVKTGFELEFYNGSHNYPKETYQERLKTMFKETSRNLYQSELHGMVHNRKEIISKPDTIDWYLAYPDRYFWLEALEYSAVKDLVWLDGKIENNMIEIKSTTGLKKLRVYLSSKMVNLQQTVKIMVNGMTKYDAVPEISLENNSERNKDPGFNFESYVDLEL